MVGNWPESLAEVSADVASDSGSVISSSSTLVGDLAGMGKPGYQSSRPHRRAISALSLDRNSPNLTSTSSFQAAPSSNTSTAPVMPFLNRSMSNPSLPSFKLKETRLPRPDGTKALSPAQLGKLIAEEPSENLMILDVRPFVEYSRSTIISALHVCLPSTLLRRKTFTIERLIENLPEDVRKAIRVKAIDRTDCSQLKVVIFDNTTQAASDGSVSVNCHGMAVKFASADKWNSAEKQRPSVYILNPGFPSFEACEPSFTVTPAAASPSSSSNIPHLPGKLDVAPSLGSKAKFFNQYASMLSPSSNPESPLPSSSPASALSKFQLPLSSGTPPPFKLARNEEVSNLESYLSAVELGEKQRSMGDSSRSSFENLSMLAPRTPFKFPLDSSSDDSGSYYNDVTPSNSKLNFQYSLLHMYEHYGENAVDLVIPKWFQDLAKVSKLDVVAQFQKIDLLEKRRLSSCFSNTGQPSTNNRRKDSSSFQLQTEQCAASWFDEYDSDEEDQHICISSGVELGSKNRYKDIFPFEHTRVVLQKKSPSFDHARSDDIWDTYINANYLVNPFVRLQNPPAEHCINVRYIATQAPLQATIHDFYTCILNNNVPLILTLTDEFENGVEKCYSFWSEGNYDGIEIKLLEEYNVEATDELGFNAGPVVLRRIQVRQVDGEVLETLQAQVRNWPDMGIMVNPRQVLEIVCLKNLVIRELFEKHVYPAGYLPTILVHCSAGCGRTGTLCALDTVLSNASKLDGLKEEWTGRKRSKETNPWSPHPTNCLDGKLFDPVIITINKFRKQRISMVQNVNQYLFIYDCLLSYFNMCLQAKECPGGCPPVLWKGAESLGIVQRFLEAKVNEKP
ncbi:LAFA_0B06678g1_1 [Lachancea sp. 'fantastica']|nr:LAFA_0B06678g1_1 [Lachancea sp. 'fantastica']